MTSTQRAILLTALPVEYQAVCAHLTDLQEKTHPKGTVYEQGAFVSGADRWEVTVVEIGPGNPAAAAEAERAIQFFEPQVILFVGVAGGAKDVALGDVVAATKVYGYESGKDEATFSPRPDLEISTYRLEQRARAEAKKGNWLSRIEEPSGTTPRAHVGPLAAGAKIVASTKSATYKFIRSCYGDALAVEMEGYGFLLAARVNPGVEALVVRGVSDLIYDKSQTEAQGTQEI
jgi:nucleoside phosphorylase